MGIVVNLSNGSMITVTVTTTWGYPVVEETGASAIEAITAAMHSVERRIAAKTEDLATGRNVRKNKMAKWKSVRNVLITGHEALGDRLVEHIRTELAEGGMVWVNNYDGDVAPRDIPVPGDWRNLRGGTSVKSWPMAPAGAIVDHGGKQWRVVVNHVHGGRPGRYVGVFSVYAIVPA